VAAVAVAVVAVVAARRSPAAAAMALPVPRRSQRQGASVPAKDSRRLGDAAAPRVWAMAA
jgi:hypothetical protein